MRNIIDSLGKRILAPPPLANYACNYRSTTFIQLCSSLWKENPDSTPKIFAPSHQITTIQNPYMGFNPIAPFPTTCGRSNHVSKAAENSLAPKTGTAQALNDYIIYNDIL